MFKMTTLGKFAYCFSCGLKTSAWPLSNRLIPCKTNVYAKLLLNSLNRSLCSTSACLPGPSTSYAQSNVNLSRLLLRVVARGRNSPSQYDVHRFLSLSARHFSSQELSGDDKEKDTKNNKDGKQKEEGMKRLMDKMMLWMMFLFPILLFIEYFSPGRQTDVDDEERSRVISFNTFVYQMLAKGEVKEVIVRPDDDFIIVRLHDGAIVDNQISKHQTYILRIPNVARFEDQLRNVEGQLGIAPHLGVPVRYERTNAMQWLGLLVLFGVSVFLITLMRQSGGIGKGMSLDLFGNMRKAKFRVVDPHIPGATRAPKIKFKDVAGLHEPKVEMQELVDYLKRPQHYTPVNLGKATAEKNHPCRVTAGSSEAQEILKKTNGNSDDLL